MLNLFSGNQKTVKEKITLSGLTIDGFKTTITLFPTDQGIIFRRKKRNYRLISAQVEVRNNQVCIGQIGMIEHLLAVLAGLGIDNIIVEVNGDALPIFDGSSQEYYDAIESTDTRDLRKSRNFFNFRNLISEKSSSYIDAVESPDIEIDVTYDPGHLLVKEKSLKLSRFEDLIRARTFAFVEEDDPRLKYYSFGLGITKIGFFPEPRYPDEPIRHKLLDLIGDLYTIGQPFTGIIRARNPYHELNINFLKRQLTLKAEKI